MFLGTPHRGSEEASYGKVLATLATAVLNRPSPRLVNALKVNSETLMQLTTDFRFQVPKYQVYSFYEMKPIKKISSLVSKRLTPFFVNIDLTYTIVVQGCGKAFSAVTHRRRRTDTCGRKPRRNVQVQGARGRHIREGFQENS